MTGDARGFQRIECRQKRVRTRVRSDLLDFVFGMYLGPEAADVRASLGHHLVGAHDDVERDKDCHDSLRLG